MLYGHLAALGAALMWCICALCFTTAGHRVGAFAVTVLRLVIAIGFFAAYSLIVRGSVLPMDASWRIWGYLSVSGVIGFLIGDLFLFKSFLYIGPRRSLLVMALWPAIAAILGVLFLAEFIGVGDVIGMMITLAGVAWVIRERRPSHVHVLPRHTVRGVAYAGIGAVCQAVGLILSKIGMTVSEDVYYDAFSATYIRVLASVAGFIVVTIVWGRTRQLLSSCRDLRALAYISGGALTGPFLGVAFSLVAVQYIATGIAATLMATAPIMVIPFVVLSGQEKVSLRAWVGACVAVIGVALLFMR